MLEEYVDVLHIKLNSITWSLEPIEIRLRELVSKGIASLPGNPPRNEL